MTCAVPTPTAWATPSDVTFTMVLSLEIKVTVALRAALAGRMTGESCCCVPTVMVEA